jgi:hypothetical protein
MAKLRILLILVLTTGFFSAFAQKRYDKSLNQTYKSQKHKPAKFKTNKQLSIICPIFVPSEYPYQGIGIKLGDPFAITYKLYATEWLAFSIDGGIAAFGLYKDRYSELFSEVPGTDSFEYFNHYVKKDTYVAAKVSFYNEGPKFLKGLDYYVSLGWQMRYVDIEYGYNEEVSVTEDKFGTLDATLDYMGPEVGLGVEYSYFNLPLSAFIEINWFYDIVYAPSPIKFQAGIGVRYVF